MEIRIEKAAAADAGAILDLMKICGAETDNLSFGEGGIPVTVEQEASYVDSIKGSDKNVIFLAKDGDEIVGMASYTVFPKKRMAHRGELGILVRRSHWNHGVGSLLMENIIGFAKETSGSEIISLEVRSDNEAAIHLYKKYGFEECAPYYENPMADAIYMRKDL